MKLPLITAGVLAVVMAIPTDWQQQLDNEMSINNILKSSVKYKNLPLPVSNPCEAERTTKDGEIPAYVLKHAPIVHLYSEERYLPYDIAKYVKNFEAVNMENDTVIDEYVTINRMGDYSDSNNVYLRSKSNFDTDPEWVTGVYNKPNIETGEIYDAPATLIVLDKGNGWVDSYWFYFYSFNLGPFVMGNGPYGNHVGDWEHSLVRFYKGKPVVVWMSAHGGGGGYHYDSVSKYDTFPDHPVLFSARGTHANYVSVGQFPHDLPYGILSDFTDRGALWNPSLNFLAYTYRDGQVTYGNGSHPYREQKYGNWLDYQGLWGDKKLVSTDPRQKWGLWEWKYIDGPRGPLRKNLVRLSPCQRTKWWNFWGGCNIRNSLEYGIGMESEGSNCGNIFRNVKPVFLRSVLQRVTWGGWLCYVADSIYG